VSVVSKDNTLYGEYVTDCETNISHFLTRITRDSTV